MAGTIKFFDEMQNASNVSGQDKMMIGKAESGETQVITFDQAKQYLDITSNEIAPIVGGDSEANATPVPAGPAGQTRRADVAPGWIDFGSGPIEAAATNRWMAYWDGSSWSLVDMGELPSAANKIDEWEIGSYATGKQVYHRGLVWEVVEEPGTSQEPGAGGLHWQVITTGQDNGSVVGINSLIFTGGTQGTLRSTNAISFYPSVGRRVFIVDEEGESDRIISGFNLVSSSVPNNSQVIIYADYSPFVQDALAFIKSATINNIPVLDKGKFRLFIGRAYKSTSGNIGFYSDLFQIWNDIVNISPFQNLVNKINGLDPVVIRDDAVNQTKKEVMTSEGYIRGDLTKTTFDETTGMLNSTALLTYIGEDGARKFVVSEDGASTFRITNFKTIADGAENNTFHVVYFDFDPNVLDGNAVLQTAERRNVPDIPIGMSRVMLGMAYKSPTGTFFEFKSNLLQFYHERGVNISPIQKLINGQGGDVKPLVGKKIVVFGDSVVQFGNYPEIISTITGATTYNVGFGGCRMGYTTDSRYRELSMYKVAETVASQDFTNMENAVQILKDVVGDDKTEFFERLRSIDFNNVDIVTIGYGTNDFTSNAIDIGDVASTDVNTIMGAANVSINHLLTAYPHLKIMFITPTHRFFGAGTTSDSDTVPNSLDIYLREYCDAIVEVANYNHLPALNLYTESQLSKYNHDLYFVDGVHPNAAGYRLLAEVISASLVSKFRYNE